MAKPSKKAIREATDWAVHEAARLMATFGETGWKYKVSYDKDCTATAMVWTPYGRRFFHLTLGPEFLGEDLEDRQDTLIHEVLHVLQRRWWDMVRQGLTSSSMKPEEHKLFEACFSHAVEVYTDTLASALAGKV